PAAQPTATALPTAVLPPQVVLVTATPAADAVAQMPSFVPADPTQVSAANQANAAATATGAAQPGATLTPLPGETATPQPTFTPPALPFTSNEDHFWLRRPVAEGGVVWTDKSYPYGSTRGGTLRPHHGVEFYVPAGTEILATASGTVVVAGSDAEVVYGPHANFYGNLIVVELDSAYAGQPVYTLYAHLSEVLVTVGQRVSVGDVIALSGATGVADGPHMHFEVRLGQNGYDSTRNPLLWLYPFPEHGAVAGRVVGPDGQPLPEVQVLLRRVDAPSKYHGTTTYAVGGVNADERLAENFAFDDVVAGYYEAEVKIGETKVTQEVWVFPYRVSSVELVVSP
ncbi:MAG: M23 family metallopeptidase, partial [Anaerolineales bacterium]|nr:M23 family metallopeptidase [Anaerolineales bacterium]